MSAQTLPVSDETEQGDGAERRVAPRTRTLKRAKILFNNNFSTFDCILRNISATGALLTLDESAHLPREFHIRIGEERTSRFAKLVYRRGMLAGIHFLDGPAAAEPAHAANPARGAETLADAELDAPAIRRIEPDPLPRALTRSLPWSRFAG